ncbi:hypothetical protein N2152v2_004668 [Parachlorella kessleri]
MQPSQQAKSRLALLQEWKEQRAAKAGTGGVAPANQHPQRSHLHAAKQPVTARQVTEVGQKENVVTEPTQQQPQLHQSQQQQAQPLVVGSALPKPAPWDNGRRPALPAGQKVQLERQYGILEGRLQALKRESLRPSLGGVPAPAVAGGAATTGSQPQFEAAGNMDMHMLSRLANQLFNDEHFCQLCDKGMSSQLTRSKDGATEETKIIELAGMVKLLRRGMKELQNRTQQFIDHAVTYEREAAQQVESVKLSSESAARCMEVELANARREAATAAASHKNDLANWQGQLDHNKAEVSRLKRELDRVEGERERAREDAKKAEVQLATAEGRLKEMEKAVGQQAKELQMDKNSAAQQMYEMREAAERQRQQLSQSLQTAEANSAELRTVNTALQQQVDKLQQSHAAANDQVQQLKEEMESAQAELEKVREDLAEHRRQHEQVVADSACVLGELQEWQGKAAALLSELTREVGGHEATKQKLEAALQAYTQDQQGWEMLRAKLAAASHHEHSLLEEKAQLKNGLTAALEQQAKLESQLQQTTLEVHQVSERLAAGQAALDIAQAQAAQLQQQVAELAQSLEEEQAATALAVREAAEKGTKLAQLEGELEALQECTIGLGAGDQREMLSRMVSKIAALEAAVAAADAKRRDIHNQLVELKGNIRVFCRVRPSPRSVISYLPDGLSVKLQVEGKEHPFSYDKVFKSESTQAEVFQEVSDLVQSALDGYKGGRSLESQGIIPRSISKILENVARLREQGWEYALEASYIEVYNETLRDLLADSGPGGRREAGKLAEGNAIQHQPNGGHTLVLGATRAHISSEEDAAAICRQAAVARAVESTAMNAVSSRSHSVFMLYITGRNEAAGTVLQGSLNLVDLAGSERLARSQAEGQRAKEACSINKSLSSLGDVFQALASKSPHIPYRNSKLTHLLQPCLGGSGKTLMFVNINPDPESAQETLCSLRFAAKVNSCETAARGGAARNVTGRQSLAPTDPEARRLSVAGGGLKRKAPAPLPPPRATRPKPY